MLSIRTFPSEQNWNGWILFEAATPTLKQRKNPFPVITLIQINVWIKDTMKVSWVDHLYQKAISIKILCLYLLLITKKTTGFDPMMTSGFEISKKSTGRPTLYYMNKLILLLMLKGSCNKTTLLVKVLWTVNRQYRLA